MACVSCLRLYCKPRSVAVFLWSSRVSACLRIRLARHLVSFRGVSCILLEGETASMNLDAGHLAKSFRKMVSFGGKVSCHVPWRCTGGSSWFLDREFSSADRRSSHAFPQLFSLLTSVDKWVLGQCWRCVDPHFPNASAYTYA